LKLFFGQGLFAMRLAAVVAGVLATAGLWFLGAELWSRRAGFVAALLFAVLAPSVHFSRDGVHYMQSVAALIWTVLCYTRATKRYSGVYAALTGILVGIDVQLYYAARLAVPLVFLHAAICAALDRGLLRNWLRLLLWTSVGLIVTFLPFAAYYLVHPGTLSQRTDAVLIFGTTPQVRSAMIHDYGHAGWLEILGKQTQRVVLGFLSMGDRSEQYGAKSPLLDPVTATLLPAACALALARIRQSPWLLCVLWTLITVTLGGILTTLQPDAPRLLAAIPAVCLLIGGLAHALLLAAGETGLRDLKPVLAIALAGSLILAAIANANSYLDDYPRVAAAQPVTLVTDIGRYLSDQSGETPVVLYDQRQFYLAHWTIQFLAPQIHGTTVWRPTDLTSTLASLHGRFLLMAVDADLNIISNVQRLYPGGVLTRVAVHDARQTVVAYRYDGAGTI
jgi:4-amino-4-deoxy-L-arabinose transferase-like glycosyltransferase